MDCLQNIKNLFGRRNRKVIYTAIFGDRDDLKPIVRQKGFDYIIFTDNADIKTADYKVIICPLIDTDPCRNARFYKMNAHIVLKDYNYSLWIDANKSINGADVNALFKKYLKKHDIALHGHPLRDCIYQEAEICIKDSRDLQEIITTQMQKYKKEGYPENNGLASTGIIFRRHSPMIARLNEAWWNEILMHSRRDQLSFNYVIWKYGIEYYTIPGHVRNKNVDGFRIFAHKKLK